MTIKHGCNAPRRDGECTLTIPCIEYGYWEKDYPQEETVEDAYLAGFQNGYEEGFEICKAQCEETHHEEMLWAERERVLKLIEGEALDWLKRIENYGTNEERCIVGSWLSTVRGLMEGGEKK